MKHLKLFEDYGAYEDALVAQNKKWNESINSYDSWIPKMYSYWKGFETTIGQKMSKLPGGIFQIETSAYPQLGYGRDLKKLLRFMENYKNPLDLVKHLDENQKKKKEIRSKLEVRWDEIFNKKGTNEEYKLLQNLQDLDKDGLSDLHWIWKTCFEDHDFEAYHEIDSVITDFADDHNLVVYLCYVELFRGLQLGFLVCDEKDEIKLSTRWNRATDEYSYVGIERKGGYSVRGRFSDDIWDGAKKVTKRLEHYFSTTSYRPLHEMIYISLANQKD
jgi:hypothetical protein